LERLILILTIALYGVVSVGMTLANPDETKHSPKTLEIHENNGDMESPLVHRESITLGARHGF
jgi:hypothetical protein